MENYKDIEEKGKRLEALINLSHELEDNEMRHSLLFNDFLHLASEKPGLVFRNIFQLFHDMVTYFVFEGKDEPQTDTDPSDLLDYNSNNLFIKGCEDPFFADRLFINRFMNLVKGLNKGLQTNRIFLFEGPTGSGKSIFLSNLLLKLEQYTRLSEGAAYHTLWRIPIEKFGGFVSFQKHFQLMVDSDENNKMMRQLSNKYNKMLYPEDYLDIPCPNHDHPILQIPKSFREKFIDELIPSKDFKNKLLNHKEFEWVLKDTPCTICTSIYNVLHDKVGDALEVFNMINARKTNFSRQFGIGISVYNPADQRMVKPITNPTLQKLINELVKNEEIKYIYSDLANTNNGIFALMDIKENNVQRLKNLHGIISDGVHKVEFIEERIKSLFMGLVNPEDKKHFENIKSFQDRVITVNIPYILDYNTEVAIYKNKFGEDITKKFLPRVLENFAKIIVSTRLEQESPTIKKWLNPSKYDKHLDRYQFLLKMDIYTGKVPTWLSEEDSKKFDRKIRKELVAESENEGKKGISGRQSLNVFNSFLGKFQKEDKLVTMDMVQTFFTEPNSDLDIGIAKDFIYKLIDMYDFNVLQEVKESIYYYNEEQISRDIMNYLFSINHEPGETITCSFTNDVIEVTNEYFADFEGLFLGSTSSAYQRRSFRMDVHKEYITKTLAQEMKLGGQEIAKTSQFQDLFNKYTRNLKENALVPYQGNDNFRRAIIDFASNDFRKYDKRMKRDIALLIDNLQQKFKYSEESAKQISIYVLDKKLVQKF